MVFLSHMFSRNSYILLAAAVLLAVLLAWEADVDERGRMAAFFTVLGDALALAGPPAQLSSCGGRGHALSGVRKARISSIRSTAC